VPTKSIASLLLLACALPAQGQDLQRGKLLYETHCAACHGERLHERDKTLVKSMADLRDQVARWAPQTKRAFTFEELEEIALYLDRSHYHLTK
jgi:mono/diheme cytochrome c family protein